MNVIIVGCGRLGAELAVRLSRLGNGLAVVDNVAESFNNLPTDFRGRTVEGDALSEEVLKRAGIETADSLAAVTNQDALNAVVGHIAKTIYHIPTVIVRNYDPDTRALYQAFDLLIVSSTSWGAQRVEDLLVQGPIRSVYSVGNGDIELYEMVISDAWDKRQLKDLLDSIQVQAISVTHGGISSLPKTDTILHSGDLLYISATRAGIDAIRERMKTMSEV